MRLEKPDVQNLLKLITVGRSLVAGKVFPQQTENNRFAYRLGTSPEYFIIVDRSEECTIWLACGSKNPVFYFDKDMYKLCRVIKKEKVKTTTDFVFFVNGSV